MASRDSGIAGDRRPATAIVDPDHFQLAEAGDSDSLGVDLELHHQLIAILRRDRLGRIDGDADAPDLLGLLHHRIDLEGDLPARGRRGRKSPERARLPGLKTWVNMAADSPECG